MFTKWLEPLSDCVLFEGVSKSDINNILGCLNFTTIDFKKNDCLTITGEKLLKIGIVLEGRVAITKENLSGNRVIVAILGPGEMFGETVAFSQEVFWSSTIIAQENCTVLFFPADKIVGCCQNSCESHQKLIMNMIKFVSSKANMLDKKVEYLAMKSLRGKISTYLLEQFKKTGKDKFQLSLNRNEMADLLNVSRPSLSREMSKMRDEGIIDFYSSSVYLLNMELLKQYSENDKIS